MGVGVLLWWEVVRALVAVVEEAVVEVMVFLWGQLVKVVVRGEAVD
jgi:hypothetical protein